MNTSQKEEIQKLRCEGYGYKKISQLIGVSENTVKSYCRRHIIEPLPKKQSEDKIHTEYEEINVEESEPKNAHLSEPLCRQCAAVLSNTPGHRQKVFCSEKCRCTFWKENADKINRRSAVQIICPVCKKSFSAYPRCNRKYCSHKCYIAYRYKGGCLNG